MQQTNLSLLILFSQIIVTSLTKDILSEWEVSIFIAFLLNILKIILQSINFFVFLGLWTSNNEAANHLLERILPAGLLQHLHSDDPVPTSEQDRLHVRDNLSMAVSDAERNKGHIVLQVRTQC